MNWVAKPTTKVIVVGNPANTNALICMKSAPNIPAKNFSALTRLDQNRACSLIAAKINCKVSEIQNLVIWGNHSKTQYPDVFEAKIGGQTLREAVNDEIWIDTEFLSKVQNRGAEIIAAMGKSSAASAARATCDHVRDMFHGTPAGTVVSMAVFSDGSSYDVPEGIVFSFPVTLENQEWKIVEGLQLNDFQKEKI